MTNTTQNTPEKEPKPLPEKAVNEYAGFYVSTHIKISDPETGKVLVNMRGDR